MIFEPKCGTYIDSACKEAVNLANSNMKRVEFIFNELQMCANPGDDPIKLTEEYFEKDQKRRDEYWTPERLQEKANKEVRDILNLSNHFETLKNVHTIENLIRWFCKFETLSFIHTSLNSDQKKYLVDKCANQFDIYAGMNCSDELPSGSWQNQSRDFKLKWLAGQALDTTIRIGCPHGIIHTFAEDFGIA